MGDLGLGQSNDGHHSFTTEENHLVHLDDDQVGSLGTPLNWLVSSSLQSYELFVFLSILSLGPVELVDDDTLVASVKVMLALRVEYGST